MWYFYSQVLGGRLLSLAVFSGIVNVLYLTSPLFMLQIYDRVMASRSTPTLIVLSVGVLLAFILQGALDLIRNRMFLRAGADLDDRYAKRLFDIVTRMALRSPSGSDAMQPVRDAETLRSFLSNGGPATFFDLPWIPVYLVTVFLLHPMLGALALGGMLVMIAIAWASQMHVRGRIAQSDGEASARLALLGASHRNGEAIWSLGMGDAMAERIKTLNMRRLRQTVAVSDRAGLFQTISRVTRLTLQSAVLGVAAYLAIHDLISAGTIIAGSVLVARTVAPLEMLIAHWTSFVAARDSARRLRSAMEHLDSQTVSAEPLPAPRRSLSVEQLTVAAPGQTAPILRDVSFKLTAGQALGIVGPSGSGKSTLARSLVGLWPPQRGKVLLDDADIRQWAPGDAGQFIGYLPQDSALFAGTLEENIARFAPDARQEDVIAAATASGAHKFIINRPKHYSGPLLDGGSSLSEGQRQMVGLARAYYGNPFLVVLDEPNAHLDPDGEAALAEAIGAIKRRGGIAVVVSHRLSGLAAVDLVAVMREGRIVSFGPRDQIMRSLIIPATSQRA